VTSFCKASSASALTTGFATQKSSKLSAAGFALKKLAFVFDAKMDWRPAFGFGFKVPDSCAPLSAFCTASDRSAVTPVPRQLRFTAEAAAWSSSDTLPSAPP
jgi:hypothetical protein